MPVVEEPTPITERQRLATLHALEILDTPAEERFDRITRIATRIFAVPVSLVTLVDEARQWFKSVQGLSICETPREESFCAHAIRERGIFLVPDALNDPRFCNSSLVRGNPSIRFYAGCPYRALNGSPLGTLCIMDRRPRNDLSESLSILQDLASWVEHEVNTIQLSQALLHQENEIRLRAMMESTNEGIIFLSPHQKVLSVNRCFLSLFGLERAQVIGRGYATFASEMQRVFATDPSIHRIFPGLANAPEQQITVFTTQSWPQLRYLKLLSSPVLSVTGDYLGRLYVFQDVTQERELEMQKSEFIAQIGHELRTPLTVIRAHLDILLSGRLGPLERRQACSLGVMIQQMSQLDRLMDNFSDFSRLETGRLDVHLETLDLLSLLQDIVDGVIPQMKRKQQTVTLLSAASLPLLQGDANRLTQVFLNLLMNAHLYTSPGGKIEIRMVVRQEQVLIEVEDTGRGMSPEELSHIFTKFYRAQPCGPERGSGLGLSIAQKLVELHNGTISVTSTPGEGSTFTVALPVRHEQAQSE